MTETFITILVKCPDQELQTRNESILRRLGYLTWPSKMIQKYFYPVKNYNLRLSIVTFDFFVLSVDLLSKDKLLLLRRGACRKFGNYTTFTSSTSFTPLKSPVQSSWYISSWQGEMERATWRDWVIWQLTSGLCVLLALFWGMCIWRLQKILIFLTPLSLVCIW